MKLIDELRAEHDLIDAVAQAFRAYSQGSCEPDLDDGMRFVRFLKVYAGDYHHAREEDVLFPALVARAALPGDRGPVAVLTDDHRRMSALLGRIGGLIEGGLGTADDRRALSLAVTEYTEALGHHIDAENSVLLPESAARLLRVGVADLPSRPPTEDEAAAKASAEELLRRYPPAPGGAIRGDGCVLCPAMSERCGGLEAEWWNEWEWEEFADHLPSG
jgi:hemerythrin-like domain-containing protein